MNFKYILMPTFLVLLKYCRTVFLHCNIATSLTWQSVWVEPDWADPGWWAGCGYLSRQPSGISATSWRTWWRGCSRASADDAGTRPCETWARFHPRGPEPKGFPCPLLRRPPPAARRQMCCPRPRWWGTGKPGCGPGKGERVRQRGSQRCRCRQRGGGQEWWSGTAVSSKGNRHESEGTREGFSPKLCLEYIITNNNNPNLKIHYMGFMLSNL